MLNLINQLKTNYSTKEPNYEELGTFVKSINYATLDYNQHLPKLPTNGDYGRNEMLLDPIECVLIYWPPKSESAIHYHAGFWGYVLVVDGYGDNVEYKLNNGILKEIHTTRALPGGVMNEPNGTIHKIVNPSETDTLITIHFYYPALENLNNLTIYDEDGRLGVLNEKAAAASFQEPREHFKTLQNNAFKFISYADTKNAKSHHIFPIIPKPPCSQINNMIGAYYAEQAKQYDLFDFNDPTRKKYTEQVDRLIINELNSKNEMDSLLALACGTGRRALEIRGQTKHEYLITGIDLSDEMCQIANQKGLVAINNDWLNADLSEKQFDACTFLYAFGHITTANDRLKALRKIAHHLNFGGTLFFDVFNINDKYEWGSNALKTFQDMELDQWGYEQGDVFYKKTDGNEIAFLHYFDENDLKELLNEAGFEIEYIKHIGYVHKSGEILSAKDEGSLFVKAIRQR